MFAKLLKHEWNWAWKQLGIVSLCALGGGVLGAVLLRFLIGALKDENGNLLVTILGILMGFLLLALVGYAIGSEIVLLYRYYKHKFTDEGYLTFTLPARSREIFLSSLVNTIAWTAIVALVAATAVGLIVLVGLEDVIRELVAETRSYYGNDSLREMLSDVDWGQTAMSLVSTLVSFLAGITISLSCITMGCTFAKKHKVLASIGIYYGVSMVKNIISSVLTVAVSFSDSGNSVAIVYLIEALIQTVLAVGGYLLSIHLMKKELNLP